MLQGEHSAILLTFIKLPFVIKIFVLSIFEWPLKTDFTVLKIAVFLQGEERGRVNGGETNSCLFRYSLKAG